MVGVAQLAEHLTVDQKVAGSRPVAHPTIYGITPPKNNHRSQMWGRPLYVKVDLCAIL
jgi:hypothetical protein